MSTQTKKTDPATSTTGETSQQREDRVYQDLLKLICPDGNYEVQDENGEWFHDLEMKLRLSLRLSRNSRIQSCIGLANIFNYKDGNLWMEKHKTFHGYAEERFGIKKATALAMRRAGEACLLIERENAAKGKSLAIPLRESHLRELVKLPTSHQYPCWEAVTSKQYDESTTAETVDERILNYKLRKGLAEPEKEKHEKAVKPALEKLKQAKQVLEGLPNTAEEIRKIDDLIDLLSKR